MLGKLRSFPKATATEWQKQNADFIFFLYCHILYQHFDIVKFFLVLSGQIVTLKNYK